MYLRLTVSDYIVLGYGVIVLVAFIALYCYGERERRRTAREEHHED